MERIVSRLAITDVRAALQMVMCTLIFSCVVDMAESELSSIYTNRFKCSKSCVIDSDYTVPVIYNVVSKMECAALCSKLPWCTMYSLVEDGNNTVLKAMLSGSCQLFMDTSSECSATSVSASNTPVCIKETDGDDPVLTRCMKTSQRVLEVVDSKPDLLVNYAYLRNLISLGFNFVVQFVSGTSKYIAEASHLKMDLGASRIVSIFLLDYMSTGAFGMTVHSFCSNGLRLSNDSVSASTSDPFYWHIQIPQNGRMATNRKVFRTGDNYSDLISAMEAGADFKLFFIGDKKLVHADVILTKRSNKISVQSRVHENGQMNLLSHLIDGSTETLTWNQSISALSGPTSENLQTIWLSSSCWLLVFSTSDNSKSQTNLKGAVESARRIRVRFSIDSLVVLATADYVQIDSTSGMVTAFLLRVLVQKSFLLDVVSDLVTSMLGGATQNPTKWTHYVVTSDGKAAVFTTPLGSSEGTLSSVAADVQWFEEVRDWELVHSSNPSNSTSLALLAAEVLNGSEVRVKIKVGSIQKWFSCDTMKVSEKDPNVKCHISSQVSANITGSSSIVSWLSTVTTGSQSCTIKSECFVVAAAELTPAVTSPCLWSSKEVLGNQISLDKVDWFVSR